MFERALNAALELFVYLLFTLLAYFVLSILYSLDFNSRALLTAAFLLTFSALFIIISRRSRNL